MLSENQRVILGDAIDCINLIKEANNIGYKYDREKEINELIERAKDDIRTVLRQS